MSSPYAALLLRLSLGAVFLSHGLLKVLVFGVPGTVAFFVSIDLPGALAYPVIAGELLGGAALLLGVFVRPVALGLALIAFGAILPHAANGWLFEAPGGGWEYPLFLALVSLVQAMLGAGAWAVNVLPQRRAPLQPA